MRNWYKLSQCDLQSVWYGSEQPKTEGDWGDTGNEYWEQRARQYLAFVSPAQDQSFDPNNKENDPFRITLFIVNDGQVPRPKGHTYLPDCSQASLDEAFGFLGIYVPMIKTTYQEYKNQSKARI